MQTAIQFIRGINEIVIPVIKLTKSKNGKTGTATFVFIEPKILQISSFQLLEGLYLLIEGKQIYTSDIKIFFKLGKPFLIKAIFIFKNSFEWFQFLTFMNIYSKEIGLFFSENKDF